MEQEIVRAGIYKYPPNQNMIYPVLQYYQIQDYFDEKYPKLPPREKTVL